MSSVAIEDGVLTHMHAPLAPDARPCEPGILARCRACTQRYGLCTASPIDVKAIVAHRWVCSSCAGAAS